MDSDADSSQRKNDIDQFTLITGTDRNTAQHFLESSLWNLEMALESFFSNEQSAAEGSVPAQAQDAVQPAVADRPKSSGSSSTPGNIHTFKSSDSSEEEEGQAFYAGGSEHSGQQILGPAKKGDGKSFVKELFKKAREHGAEVVDPASAMGSSSSRSLFHGTGFRLGSSEASSEVVASSSSPSDPPRAREFILKMWQNGFSIDDGELRNYNDIKNREFLTSVMAGQIPKELITEARGGEVHVNMEDHKDEQYRPPKVAVKPFQGQGHVLGSIVPQCAGATSQAAATPCSSDNYPELEAKAQRHVGYSDSEDSTTIQIRLPDGGRLVVKMNSAGNVGQLRDYIRIARPQFADATFSLWSTYPNRELGDDTMSLKEAQLLGASVLLRLK